MNNSMEKLERIRVEIETESQKDAENIVSEAKKNAEESIAAKKQSLKAEFDSEAANAIESFRVSEKKRVSEKRSAEERQSIMYRGELIDRFFEETADELRKIAASPEYDSYLERCAGKAREYFPQNAVITAYCRAEDVPAAKKALSGEVSVCETQDIRIGGLMFRCEGQNAFVDMTFDTALEQERESFASKQELQL